MYNNNNNNNNNKVMLNGLSHCWLQYIYKTLHFEECLSVFRYKRGIINSDGPIRQKQLSSAGIVAVHIYKETYEMLTVLT